MTVLPVAYCKGRITPKTDKKDEKMTKYEQLVNDFSLCNAQANIILNKAAAESRTMDSTEKAEVERLLAEGDALQAEIDRVGQMSTGRKTAPQQPMAQNRLGGGSMGREVGPQVPRGYASFKAPGEFFQAVKNSCARGGTMDPRLIMDAPTTTSTEGAGADGGFLVPPQWSRDIFSTVMGEGSLVDRCNVVPVTGNQIRSSAGHRRALGTLRRGPGFLES
jgi:HK97 family phage major capsid protein